MLILVMGVSGSGKSTVGQALATALGCAFADADDFHPSANKDKMAQGQALTDADRQPWLELLHGLLVQYALEHKPLVLVCSALKAKYRQTLIGNLKQVQIVFLHGSPATLEARMLQRQHFMPPSLLQSQLDTLEPPDNALWLDIEKPVWEMVSEIKTNLESQKAKQVNLF